MRCDEIFQHRLPAALIRSVNSLAWDHQVLKIRAGFPINSGSVEKEKWEWGVEGISKTINDCLSREEKRKTTNFDFKSELFCFHSRCYQQHNKILSLITQRGFIIKWASVEFSFVGSSVKIAKTAEFRSRIENCEWLCVFRCGMLRGS